MKKMLLVVLSLAFSCQLMASSGATVAAPMSPEYQATLTDIKATMGLVPTFMKVYPPQGLVGEWQFLKGVELGQTAIPAKYKELIGVAVASQIPCDYCVYAHTQFAKLNGATTAEIQEAVSIAALEREWSTMVNARPISTTDFAIEVDAMLSYMQNPNHIVPMGTPDMTATEKDVLATFGRLPSFIKNYPTASLDGAWSTFKGLIANPNTAIPVKYKDLIALAVSAQIPCNACSYMDRGFAKMDGATDQELNEAAAMAAITRHWSTVLNGNQLDMGQFKKEINQIVAFVKKAMAAPKK